MIRKIIGFLKNCGTIGYLLAGIIYLCALLTRYMIVLLLGMLAGYLVSSWSGSAEFIILSMTAGVMVSMICWASIDLAGPLGFLTPDALLKDPKEAAAERAQKEGIFEKYDELPHFGKLLKKDQVLEILSHSSFSSYKTKDGRELKNVLISEDDKWLCLFDGYMPVDMICGFNHRMNVLYTIDGGVIKLPFKAKLPHIRKEIESFFKDRGHYYDSKPRKAVEKFDAAYHRPLSSLDKADFSKLRYMWEKANADDKNGYLKNEDSGKKYMPVFEDGQLNDAIFNRVLSDVEIARTADAIRKKKKYLAELLDFGKYSSEFCVCNTVAVLNYLRYPANSEGIDFLFKCLGDVDEAYFGMAVENLKDYPRGQLEKKIEKNVQLAFENSDVVGLGGLMFFAKEINYEIKYVEGMKETQTTAESDTALEFDFDELTTFGSEEVQGFAYQKQ